MQSVQILTLVLLALGARADRTSLEKDGFCPDLSIINCSKTCSDDASCPENLKCCQQGSKRLCVNTTQEKDGMCPLATSSSSSLNGLFSEKCDTDKDCSGNAKCCDSFCGRICVMPLKVKAGRCPANEICPIRSRPCSQDSHCKGEKKCCSTGCGWRCMEPFLEE